MANNSRTMAFQILEPDEEQPSEEAGVSPCEAQLEVGDTQPQEEDVPAVWGA